ncbi:Uncharacterised protein [Streptococcus suis]|uniref:Uncharacterized protein n=1 Tax=Streptococcus suis TaxID=1307 RepID=A0A0Z8H4Y2_STRSU|nr:Uncharacterised protein [Streptococcus suis]
MAVAVAAALLSTSSFSVQYPGLLVESFISVTVVKAISITSVPKNLRNSKTSASTLVRTAEICAFTSSSVANAFWKVTVAFVATNLVAAAAVFNTSFVLSAATKRLVSFANTSASEVTCSRTFFASSTVVGVFTASETVAVVVAASSVDLAVAVSVEAVVVVSEVAAFSSAFFTTLTVTIFTPFSVTS